MQYVAQSQANMVTYQTQGASALGRSHDNVNFKQMTLDEKKAANAFASINGGRNSKGDDMRDQVKYQSQQ